MDRKEKLKLMFSCQNGVTEMSQRKLVGFNNDEFSGNKPSFLLTIKESVRRLSLQPDVPPP